MVFSQKLSFLFSELKPRRGDSASLMQVGAFMQVMDEDARMVSGVIGLKLQMAGDVDSPVVIRAAILIVDKLPAILVLGKMAMRERLPSREKSWQDATHTGWLLQVRFIMRPAGH